MALMLQLASYPYSLVALASFEHQLPEPVMRGLVLKPAAESVVLDRHAPFLLQLQSSVLKFVSVFLVVFATFLTYLAAYYGLGLLSIEDVAPFAF